MNPGLIDGSATSTLEDTITTEFKDASTDLPCQDNMAMSDNRQGTDPIKV
jgi:hypothetical protein